MHPVVFLVVAGKMLDGYADTGLLLYAPGHCRRHHTAHQRILREILKIAPAQGIPVDVHARRQPHRDAECPEFLGDRFPDRFHQFRIESLRQHRPDRDRRRDLIPQARPLMPDGFVEKPYFEHLKPVPRLDDVSRRAVDLDIIIKIFELRRIQKEKKSMKKFRSLLIAIIMVFVGFAGAVLAACGGNNDNMERNHQNRRCASLL